MNQLKNKLLSKQIVANGTNDSIFSIELSKEEITKENDMSHEKESTVLGLASSCVDVPDIVTCVSYLLQIGFDPLSCDSKGDNALFVLMDKIETENTSKIVQLYHKYYSSIVKTLDANGNTPLMRLMYTTPNCYTLDLVRLLISLGCDTGVKNKNGKTVVDITLCNKEQYDNILKKINASKMYIPNINGEVYTTVDIDALFDNIVQLIN
jgi:ankyrin repeat protein